MLSIAIAVYILGSICTALMFMFDDEDSRFKFSWHACLWGLSWAPLVFLYGPYIVVRDLFRGDEK